MSAPERTILVSGYFGPEGRDPKLNYFARLDRALQSRGLRLFLLNLNGTSVPAGLRGESMPFLVEKAHWLPLDRFIPRAEVDPAIVQSASLDAGCWERPLAREIPRLLLFREHLRRVLARERPCLHIAWHQFHSFHHSLPAMLGELGVPLLFAEFGPLPGTIIFDAEGQMAESSIVRNSEEFIRSPVSAEELKAAEEFLSRVRSEKRTRKPQSETGTVRNALRERNARARPVIFYAGQYDYRTGMVPRSLPHATLHSPFFSGTLDALSFLSRLARRNNWLILFKPHPLARHSEASMAQIAEPDSVVSVPGASIFECIECSQAVTTIVSQTSYMALVHGRPCVMLGRNHLTGKECAYEPESIDEIEGAFQTALVEGLTADQEAHWKRHVAQLLKRSVFAFDKDLDLSSLRGDAAAADFLAATCAAGDSASAAERKGPPGTLERVYTWMKFVDPVFTPLRGRLGRRPVA